MERKQPKLIDTFQYRYIFQILVLFLFFLVITVILTKAFTLILLHSDILLSRYWLWTLIYCLLLAVFLGMLFFRWIFEYSLRIVWPLHQLKNSLGMLLAGNTEQSMKIGRKTEWAELLELYNQVLKKINTDMSFYQDTLLDNLKQLEKIEILVQQLPPCSQKDGLLEQIKRLRESCLLEHKE